MDIVTQALLGATLAQSAARKAEIKYAAMIGAASGVLADADILIQSPTDSLLTIEFHRHFSHALIFIPIGGLLAALLLWPLLRQRLGFARIYLYAVLGYSLSGLLDACTSYGTHLLWPFSDERIAWHIISIIDPVFTLVLLLAVIFTLHRRAPRVARSGLAVAGLYLLLGVVQLQRAESVAQELAAARGHELEQLVVKPTLGNLLLWRSIYQAQGIYYIDAVRVGLGNRRSYAGESIPRFDMAQLAVVPAPDSVLAQDLQRFAAFSDGYIALHPQRQDVLGDVRCCHHVAL
ncbi:MAG: metal-dependent hydrolase, partial [Gammaproteobacteria bacterium]